MLAIAKASHGDFKTYYSTIKKEFNWYKSEGWPENHAGFKKGQFQFTAYYAPAAVEASSTQSSKYPYPVYRNPNVVNVVAESKLLNLNGPLCGIDPVSKMVRGYCIKNADGTYAIAPDRDEIEHGAIDSKYIIAYLKDTNDAAFLMLQGSGSLLIDGKLFHLNYAGANGRPRTMLGRIVQCAQDPTCGGNIDAMEQCAKNPKCHDEAKLKCNVSQKIKQSAGTEKLIRQYLDSPLNRDKAFNLRNRDQSFIFFAKDNEGPYGSEHIALTPHVSCATDHRVIPVGMNFIYQCKNTVSWCVAQDSGGAIIGAHVDIYKGAGHQAGIEANAINHSGAVYVALPKKLT
jgi:membrane-bound lytic murein transglycosylase